LSSIITAVWDDCLREMKPLPLAAFNTLCILGSSLNYLQNNHFVNTDKVDNPEHKFSSLSRSQSCQQSFFGASRSSRNSRKRLEIKRNQVFDPFWGGTRGTNFFVGLSGCIFCCPKIFLLSHHLPLPKSWICQKNLQLICTVEQTIFTKERYNYAPK